jgi:hypothetical protein
MTVRIHPKRWPSHVHHHWLQLDFHSSLCPCSEWTVVYFLSRWLLISRNSETSRVYQEQSNSVSANSHASSRIVTPFEIYLDSNQKVQWWPPRPGTPLYLWLLSRYLSTWVTGSWMWVFRNRVTLFYICTTEAWNVGMWNDLMMYVHICVDFKHPIEITL